MKKQVFSLIAVGLVTSFVWADAKPKNIAPAVPMQRLEASLGTGCKFAVTLPGKKGTKSPIDSSATGVNSDVASQSGVIVASPQPAPWRSMLTSLQIGVVCYDKDDSNVNRASLPIAYDIAKREWRKDATAWEKEASDMTEKSDREHLLELIHTTHVTHINSINSQGWAMTQDEIAGDERWRKRSMHFCLVHESKALCGGGTVAYLADGRKGDLTKYALDILKSIEFLEDAPASVTHQE
jgi:hypothetical protein